MSTHGHDHGHDHGHGHDRGHDHGHGGAFLPRIKHALTPHSHDTADSIDDALTGSREGITALKVSLVVLLATTVLQFAIYLASGSVALLADTIHNFADALTAVPLWVAFSLARRPPTRRYTYGFHRAEDLAGLFVVVVIALSAVTAAWQSIDRLASPQPLNHAAWVIAAGIVGFAGNEIVALYRIRVGRRIGSAALVADGVHARTDGLASLAVVVGGMGALLGIPLLDPLVGLGISALILALLVSTVRSVGRRLLDGIEPELTAAAESALAAVPGVVSVDAVRLRWSGHIVLAEASLALPDMALREADAITRAAEASLKSAVPRVDRAVIATRVIANHPH